MSVEPIPYIVGDSTVRIDDAITGIPDERRVYWYRVTTTRNGVSTTTAYRVKVLLSDVLRLTDHQVAEFLLRRAARAVRLFSFRGEHLP